MQTGCHPFTGPRLSARPVDTVDISPETFREVLGHFATGVTVVTTRLGDELHGATVNAFASVSLDPPLVLVSINKDASSHDLIAGSGVFAVNILHAVQSDLAAVLARKGTEEADAAHRLAGIPHRIGTTGAPVLLDSLAFADCRVVDTISAGDHTIFVGHVADGGSSVFGTSPLIYHRGRYYGLGGSEPPIPAKDVTPGFLDTK